MVDIKNKNKFPSIKILAATAVFWLYVVFAAYPFLVANQPSTEATSQWRYDYAPLYYALIFFPIYFAYFMVVADNIVGVRRIRKLVYPVCFVTLFAATHMVFFIYGMVILWFAILTVPIGLLALFGGEIWAFVLDAKDKSDGDVEKSVNDGLRKKLNVIGRVVVPAALVLLMFCRYLDITVYHPRMVKEQEEERLIDCQRNKTVIRTAMNNVGINMEKASFKEIADKYQAEFSKTDIYVPILGKDYGIVKVASGRNFAQWEFLSAQKGGYAVHAIYSFHRGGECGKDYKNCYWNTGACPIYVDGRKMIGEN